MRVTSFKENSPELQRKAKNTLRFSHLIHETFEMNLIGLTRIAR